MRQLEAAGRQLSWELVCSWGHRGHRGIALRPFMVSHVCLACIRSLSNAACLSGMQELCESTLDSALHSFILHDNTTEAPHLDVGGV